MVFVVVGTATDPLGGVAGGSAGFAAAELYAAGVAWNLAQLSNSCGDTTNARKRMFAWLAPQYSTQTPLNAASLIESGVNQMWFTRFGMTSRFPASAGIQNE